MTTSPTRGRATSVLRMFRWLVLLAIASLSALALGIWSDLTSAVAIPGEIEVLVPAGQGFAATVLKLQQIGVVRRVWPLRLWARWNGFDRQIHSGDFRFEGALSPIDVLGILRAPPNALHRVTIPEGTTAQGVYELFAAAGFGSVDAFQQCAANPRFLNELGLPATGVEGYLYPDTYGFISSTDAETIMRAMVARFREIGTLLNEPRNAAQMSEHTMVTLASIIEKETGVSSERALVSAVFQNRLRRGMRLQSDPTAVYGRAEGSIPRAADLQIDTPYNTYMHGGLPPGPICNPGRAALEAALQPAAVPYIYFVARHDGGHEFSVSLEDHNRAVERYRRR